MQARRAGLDETNTMSASSLADDLTARLARQIDLLAASLDDAGSRSEGSQAEEEEDADKLKQASSSSSSSLAFLSAALSRVRHTPSSSLSQLTAQVDAALQHQTELQNGLFVAKNENAQIGQIQWILNAHLTVAAWGAVLRQLMDQAEKVRDEENYWLNIEGEDASSILYIIQSEFRCNSEHHAQELIVQWKHHQLSQCGSQMPLEC